jgi:hypothetical protein
VEQYKKALYTRNGPKGQQGSTPDELNWRGLELNGKYVAENNVAVEVKHQNDSK